MMVKVDMAKAYDRVEWQFLLHVLSSFGFPVRFCKLIDQCISTLWFLVMMNGTMQGFFKSSSGLRQGDPLSPYLFIIMQEVLTRLLKRGFQERRIGCFSHSRGASAITHLMYADDLVIFANAGKKSIRELKKVLCLYESWSGQKINKEKTAIFFSENCSVAWKGERLRDTSFKEGQFPITYLGVSVV